MDPVREPNIVFSPSVACGQVDVLVGKRCSPSTFSWKSVAISILSGQILSLFIAVTAICSTYLANAQANLPLTQNLWHYCLLTICYSAVRLFFLIRQRRSRSLTTPDSPHTGGLISRRSFVLTCLYLVAGVVDTHANWAMVASYRFTTVTSIQLLDCLGIPAVILFSFLFLRHRFHVTHYVAVVVCLLGAAGMVAIDTIVGHSTVIPPDNTSSLGSAMSQPDKNMLLGDALVILGSVAYAFSNVLQQFLVMRYGIVNFLAFASLGASLPTLIYCLTMERVELSSILVRTDLPLIVGCSVGYTAAMFALYSLMPYVLSRTSAVRVNLSLLTADIYALLMGVYLFHYDFNGLYIVCFAIILFGVGLFGSRSPTVNDEYLSCLSCLNRLDALGCDVTGGSKQNASDASIEKESRNM